MIYFQLPWCKCQKKKLELQIQIFLQFFSTPLIIIRTCQVMKEWIFLIWDTVFPASHSAESRSLKTTKYTYHTVSEAI